MSAPVLPSPAQQSDPPAAAVSRPVKLTQFVWRLRLSALCICLAALAFVQEPGRIASDTKLDLAINPGGLLARALHLWDPESFSGSLQNQAYGYLWPMGPYYLITDTLGIPAWIAQRMWWSILLCLAFLGVVRLVRLLDLGSPLARTLAGLAYALSPMMLSKLGPISSEVLPIALAPWMLIPLVAASRGAPVRRSALLSALAVFCMGGVNAAATLAVLPLGLIWILTRQWTRDTRRLLGWWLLGLLMACLWWIIPLLTLGRYSPPFLDWIEAAEITTRFTDPASTLRGTPDWIAYLLDTTGPVWEMGWLFTSSTWLAIGMAIITVCGMVGLTLRGLPNRSFLVLSLLAGFLLVSIGHVGELQGFGSQFLQDSLNAFLVPFRNVHKFDPVLRLPLVLGLAWAITVCLRAMERNPMRRPSVISGAGIRRSLRSVLARLPLAGVALALAVTVVTALSGPMTSGRSYTEIPDYWQESAQWLSQQPAGGKALVVPGASFAQLLWGRTQDEPYQALGAVAWDVRDAVPLGNAGHTRVLDVIGQQLESGRGSAALADYLHRSGFNYLVMRNDIDTRTLGQAQLASIHQAVANSPGIELVKTFGPSVTRYVVSGTSFDYGLDGNYPAIEIFQTVPNGDREVSPVVLRDASHPVVLDGSAEGTYRLLQQGAVGQQTVVLRDDPGAAELSGTGIASDTGQKQEVNFGFSRDNQSDTMMEDQPYEQRRKVYDYLNVGAQLLTFAELNGVAELSASSSGSDVDAFAGRDPGATPFAAIDGDPTTAWHASLTNRPIGEWWRVDFERPTELGTVQLRLLKDQSSVVATRLVIETTGGSRTVDVDTKADVVDVPIDQTSRFLAIRLAGIEQGSGGTFGIAEVSIPGVQVERPLRVDTDGPREGAVFSVQYGDRDDCVQVETTYRCSPFLGRASAERSGIDRWVWLAGGDYRLTVGTTGRPGQALDNLLIPLGGTEVTASSSAYRSPLARAQAAADGSMTTAWQASELDRNPWLELKLSKPQTVTGIQISNLFQNAVSLPIEVRVTAGGREVQGPIDSEGILRFPPVRTSTVRIDVLTSQPIRTWSGGRSVPVPVGVAEVSVLGVPNAQLPGNGQVPFSCGFGPAVTIDGVQYPTGGSITFHQLLNGGVAPMQSCGTATTVPLQEGWHRITAKPSSQLAVDSLSVLPAGQMEAAAPAEAMPVGNWGATSRTVDISAADHRRTLETNESFNPGWTATLAGQNLQPVQVDGWRQAWIVPSGLAGTADLNFAPDTAYRWGLLIGLLAALALVVLAVRFRNEPDSAPSGSRSLLAVLGVGTVLVIALTGGIGGLAAGGIAVGLVLLLNRWIAARVIVGVTVGLALLLAAVWTWPASQTQPTVIAIAQGAMVFAALSVVSFSAMGSESAAPRFFRRRHQEGPRE